MPRPALRLQLLLGALAAAIVVAALARNATDGATRPRRIGSLLVGPADTASAASIPSPGPSGVDTAPDSAERAYLAELTRQWLGPQRWSVAPGGTDSTFDFLPVHLHDSSAVDIMEAFPSLRAMRDSAREVELLGELPGRARLGAGDVDSIVRVGARDNYGGCTIPLTLPMRASAADGVPEWFAAFVPGMATVVAPADTNALAHRAEALRLFAAFPDTTVQREVRDSLRGAPWSEPSLELWREDGREILVASRRASVKGSGGFELWAEEEVLVAERPIGATGPFARTFAWHSAYGSDETDSMWLAGMMRVGPQRRLVFLTGFEGEESGGGSLMVRGPDGTWRDAATWSSGC